MTKPPLALCHPVCLAASLSFFAVFAGCVVESSRSDHVYAQTEIDFEDDYDYYPEYETYYSIRRHEFVYIYDGGWVRRPEPPPGVTVNVILAAPAVHVDFHDAPQHHHREVVRSYPKNWRGPTENHPTHQEHPNPPPERRDGKAEEHHDDAPDRPVLKPAPSESKPEHPPEKPNHPPKKKPRPKEEHQDKKSDEDKDGRKDERRSDK